MNYRLYNLWLAEDAQTLRRLEVQNQVASAGTLSGADTPVEGIAAGAGQHVLTVQPRSKLAAVQAAELDELFRTGPEQFAAVPYYGVDNTLARAKTPDDGYYTPREITDRALDPRTARATDFEGVMIKAGTRNTHWRAVRTTVRQLEHGFGNDQTATLGVPAAATKRRWYDGVGQTTAAGDPDATVEGEFASVDRYDVEAAPYDDPVLLYDIPYDEIGKADVRVWDTRGEVKVQAIDGVDINHWQCVFHPDHEFDADAEIVIDTTRLRVRFDEDARTLTAEEWDTATSDWTSRDLGAESDGTDWQILDVDLTEVAETRVTAQVLFEDVAGGQGLYALDCVAHRGADDLQWTVPAGEDPPMPDGLEEKLAPIADTQDFDHQGAQTLVPRSEVRK